MLLKKSTIALCSSDILSSLTSPCRTYRVRPIDGQARRPAAPRAYATISIEPSDAASRPSPPKWPSNNNPTPYDIFGQTRHAPYNRARYYELVKLYHPDRHHLHAHDGVPQSVKLERYRLVLAANDILSDPVRRRQYDLHGAGWGVLHPHADVRAADRSWRQEPGNASMNATWEDWERWYQQRDGSAKQQPVYMSNLGFATVIAGFIIVAAWGQATRAGRHGNRLVSMQEEKHDKIRQELWRKQTETAQLTREGRVENFLRQRDDNWPR